MQVLPTILKHKSLLKFPETLRMRLRICVPASYFITIAAAAASYTPYFYTTENVTAEDIICEEEVSEAASENSCAIKCARQRCYRFRWNNGKCNITRRGNVTSPLPHTIDYKKVCFVHLFAFAA